MEQATNNNSNKLKQLPHDLSSLKTASYDINARDRFHAIWFLGPSLLVLAIFVFYPMLRTLYLSLFLTNNLGKPTVFVGLQNYLSLLTSSSYLASLQATFIYVIAVSVLTLILGLLLAQAASFKVKGSSFFRTVFSGTMGVSVSVAAIFGCSCLTHQLVCWIRLPVHLTYQLLIG